MSIDHFQTFFGVRLQGRITADLHGTPHYLVVDPNDLTTIVLIPGQAMITRSDRDSMINGNVKTAQVGALHEAEQRCEVRARIRSAENYRKPVDSLRKKPKS